MLIVDAHRADGKRFIVRADEKLTAFLELESAIRAAERPEDCGLVFVDCQFCRIGGKMKGSTKPQRMDEPFSM